MMAMPPQSPSIQYAPATSQRAERALSCSPFQLKLFTTMRSRSVFLPAIAGQAGVEEGYTQLPLSERRVEGDLQWLIQVGLLRREVDGQGITDGFRLTPLGRQLVETWESQGDSRPQLTWQARLGNFFSRYGSLILPV
jgi:hypothetical protein